MKNILNQTLIFCCFFILLSCSNDMSKSSRIKDSTALKNIHNIALINFSILRDCTIGSGEDVGFVDNEESIRHWGKGHLLFIYDIVKTHKSPSFLDLNEMIKSNNYKNLKLSNTYVTNRIESLPHWLSPGKNFMKTFESLGVVELNSNNSIAYCDSLNTDAVLSIEVTYGLEDGFNIPILGNFIKPNWTAFCNVNSNLFNSKGDLVWHYEFKVDSPIKVKANKSLNLILYSTSSITGKQTSELLTSVEEYSSKKLTDALFGDLLDTN